MLGGAPTPGAAGSTPVPGDDPTGPASDAAAPLVWANVTSDARPAPGALDRASLAFDPNTANDLLFGGQAHSNWVSDTGGTWSYANGAWTELHPSLSPPNASGDTMAYDPSQGAFVLVAQTVVSDQGNQPASTWEFANSDWSELNPNLVGGPPGTSDGAMAYDPVDHMLVRFGGYQAANDVWGYQYSNATWVFEAGGWFNASSPTSPPQMVGPAMAYDPAEGGMVLFGGTPFGSDGSSNLNQTWLWSNWTWTQLTLPWSPPHLTEAALEWDTTVGGLVLTGGTSLFGVAGKAYANNQSFAFVDGRWTNLTPAGTFPGAVAAGVGYDPSSGGPLLYGGFGGSQNRNTTWVLARAPALSIVSDRVTEDAGNSVRFSDPLVGAAPGQNVTWAFGDGQTAIGGNVTHTFAASGTYTVNVTGSLDSGGSVLTSWAVETVTIVPAPAAKVAVASGYVDVNAYASASATANFGVGPYTVAWSFGDGSTESGVWSVAHRYLTPGNFTIGATVVDSLGGTSTAQVPVHVQQYPRVDLRTGQSVYDLGQNVSLRAVTQYGAGPFTYTYAGLPPGCVSANNSTYQCQPSNPGVYNVEVTVLDANGIHVTSGLAVLTINPLLAGALNVSSRVIDVGASVDVGAEFASQGSGNVSVSFAGPVACVGVDPLEEVCTPSAPGTYLLGATATDLAGAVVPLTETELVVNPGLGLNAAVPTGLVDRGTVVAIGVTVLGGTAPFRLDFVSVPRGCTSVNATAFRCDFGLAGTYRFAASVTDAVGATATVHAEVTVRVPDSGIGAAPAPAPPTPGSTNYVFWGLVAAAIAEIALSVRYAKSPDRRWRERMERIRKGLWSVFGSARTDASDADAVPGADAPP